ETAVRRDIEEWLRGLEQRLYNITGISEDERKRAIKAAVRYQLPELDKNFRFVVIDAKSSRPIVVRGRPVRIKLLERHFEFFTSAKGIQKHRQIVGEKLAAGDLLGAYEEWRKFEISIQLIDMFLKQPDVQREEKRSLAPRRPVMKPPMAQ